MTPAAPTAAAPLPVDLSPLALFLVADPVVKGVMIGLALASAACWAIVLDKVARLRRLRREAALLERRVAGVRRSTRPRAGAKASPPTSCAPGSPRRCSRPTSAASPSGSRRWSSASARGSPARPRPRRSERPSDMAVEPLGGGRGVGGYRPLAA
jgi:hypothetical protein